MQLGGKETTIGVMRGDSLINLTITPTENGKIGYVAAMPTPEVIRGINAFTLGVRSVNPEATVQVSWTNTWYDPAVEKQAAEEMAKKVSDFANSDFGIGITGNLDETGVVNKIYYSIYVRETNESHSGIITISGENRDLMKKCVVNNILEDNVWNMLMKN